MTRRFYITIEVEAVLELDDEVIDVVTPEWRSQFYNLTSDKEIAEHIAENLFEGRRLSYLDGWADQSDMNACLDVEWTTVEAEEAGAS